MLTSSTDAVIPLIAVSSNSVKGYSQRPVPSGTEYKLKRYVLRSLLSLFGPLLLLSIYCFIVAEYLLKQPVNDVIQSPRINAGWAFYVWFIAAIFTLDWARAGLANIEAAALMMPRLAPQTAASLMWHTDMKWANPLWWLRALRDFTVQSLSFLRTGEISTICRPNLLWFFLSRDTLLLFIAIPLSGLTIELTSASVASNVKALIHGPNSTTFNARGASKMRSRVYNYWQSGRPATPLYDAILYAPETTLNASTTYFDDQARLGASTVRFFTAPSVRENVAGSAWGMESEISCLPVTPAHFELLQVHDINDYSINICSPTKGANKCSMTWTETLNATKKASSVAFPSWFNRTGGPNGYNISIIAAADGWNQDWYGSVNPYTQVYNHDNLTVNHINGKVNPADKTMSIFELFLWQATQQERLLPKSLTEDTLGIVQKLNRSYGHLANEGDATFYGIGIRCNVTSAVGNAIVDPGSRAYYSFERGSAPSYSLRKDWGDVALTAPLQQLALKTLRFETEDRSDATVIGSLWSALHNAIGSAPLPPSEKTGGYLVALSPADLQLAIYRLLGDSAITMMDESGVAPWHGELFTLESTRYIKRGVVPWWYVVILLSLWAALTSGGAVWLLLYAGPRWAPSLDGFEMFKFGAQYPEYTNNFETVDFQGCAPQLSSIPGMVGVLPGTPAHPPDPHDHKTRPGFIGLSENRADRGSFYTLNRAQAATTRQIVT